jgi:hypothetical protein
MILRSTLLWLGGSYKVAFKGFGSQCFLAKMKTPEVVKYYIFRMLLSTRGTRTSKLSMTNFNSSGKKVINSLSSCT